MRFGGESLGFSPEEIESPKVPDYEGPNIENKEVLRSREKEPYREYPYSGIMVFGHGFRAERERLSQEARIRVLAAYQLYKDGVAPKIIVTGGMPSAQDKEKFGNDLKSNGELMRDFLVNDLGVPDEHVVFEDKSTKTVDNVGHALNVLNENNPGHDAGKDNYVTVSTGYHMARITEIMKKFGLKSAPVGAEWGLLARAEEHAKKMRTREVMAGLTKAQIEKNYEMRLHRYDRYVDKLSLTNPTFIGELKNEGKWLDSMQQWGYWGPLALAVRGDKLKEIVEENREDIEYWLARHPEIDMTIEDILEGNFDYMDLVEKGREVPSTKYPYNGILYFGHGARESVDRLSQEARIRLLACFQLWKDGVAPKIIITGGLPATDKRIYGDDAKTSGELIRDFLVDDLGVPEDALVFEHKSTKTVDNVAHALNEMEKLGIPTNNLVTVSTGYHMERVTEIMRKFGLKTAPVSAEQALLSRAKETADSMRIVDEQKGLSPDKIEENYQMRLHWYDSYLDALKLTSENLQGELRDEPKWLEAMKQWSYWGPLALAVKGKRLKTIIENNRDDIERWLEKVNRNYPDLNMTMDDLLSGNFDYLELVEKGRELPS